MKIEEGDEAKRITAFGKTFTLYYGYYAESDRSKGKEGLMPIYPDFRELRECTNEGFPFVTQMQAVCARYTGRQEDGFCADCLYYRDGEDLIGICLCEERRCRRDGTR